MIKMIVVLVMVMLLQFGPADWYLLSCSGCMIFITLQSFTIVRDEGKERHLEKSPLYVVIFNPLLWD
jgi:hypothetical protein